MSIVLTRIDDRLIHGQVVEGWLKHIDIDHIAIISNDVAADKMQQVLFSIAVPKNIKVVSLSVADAVSRGAEGFFDKHHYLLLLSSPQDVLSLVKGGLPIASVNVGGMHFTQGKRQILKALSVNDNDVSALMELHEAGVDLEGRVLPGDDAVNIVEVLVAHGAVVRSDQGNV